MHQEIQHQVNVIYLTFTLTRKEERRDEVSSEVLFLGQTINISVFALTW